MTRQDKDKNIICFYLVGPLFVAPLLNLTLTLSHTHTECGFKAEELEVLRENAHKAGFISH
jgi:hypothetical protein